MSLSNLCFHKTEAERHVNRSQNCLPEKLETSCTKHLSFLLDRTGKEIEELFGDSFSKNKDPVKKKPSTPFSKKKESPLQMNDRFLSHDQVTRIHQLSEFLQRSENIRMEGLFRKSGNVSRQHLLKEWVNQFADLHLDDGTFSPHDCANVLKSCISKLPEPLLTEKHFEAHCQIVNMNNSVTPGEDGFKVKDKQIKALQLLFLLIPVMFNETQKSRTYMLSPLEFYSTSEIFTKAVSFMIENTQFLFKHDGATASHTVVRFAERKSSDELESSQETQVVDEYLYAHLQVKPRSSKKTILPKQKHFPLWNKYKHHNAFSEEVESCGMGLNKDNKKMAMIAPRCRTPIILLNSPKKYLESDL